MKTAIKLLKPIKESTEDFEKVEKKIIELFKEQIYFPLLKELDYTRTTLMNAKRTALTEALHGGRITFYHGQFSGRLNAAISRELKAIGAKWDRRQGVFKIPFADLPIDVKNVVAASETRFQQKVAGIDQKLAQMLPEEIADKLKVEKYFDTTLWKTDREFKQTVKDITLAENLTPAARKTIATEWQNNMKLWIKDWTQKEIKSLRKEIRKSVFTGNRYESMIGLIQKSYGVSQNKAKFLARQETSLLMAKFKETRYTAAGVNEYKWGCVKMPHQQKGSKYLPGQVRYDHGILEGKIFRWDNPPVTDDKGSRNNPGQDYNCRCFAIPVVRFNVESDKKLKR